MKPMEPMKPLHPMTAWWDEALGQPDSAGGQDDIRYAYFANARRLSIQRGGDVSLYDTGEHRILGVAQTADAAHPRFTSDQCDIELSTLKQV